MGYEFNVLFYRNFCRVLCLSGNVCDNSLTYFFLNLYREWCFSLLFTSFSTELNTVEKCEEICIPKAERRVGRQFGFLPNKESRNLK